MSNTYNVWWLVLYVVLNLLVTVLNKVILKTLNVPFPQALVLWHYTCSAIGSYVVVNVFKAIEPSKLDYDSHKKLFFFSVLFNVNILVSAVSLNMVSMPLHQIVRALAPAFTVVISFIWLSKRYKQEILSSLAVIFVGVCIYAWKGEVDYTLLGLVVTLFGTFLAAFKGVLTNRFMVGSLKLHPFDLLRYMSFYACVQMWIFLISDGTLVKLHHHLSENASGMTYVVLLINGTSAFALNIVSFMANKKTSPLAMNIGGISKQVLAIGFGIVIFQTPVTYFSLFGVLITVCGIAWYANANFRNKAKGPTTILIKDSNPQESLHNNTTTNTNNSNIHGQHNNNSDHIKQDNNSSMFSSVAIGETKIENSVANKQ
eukprot:m.29098 g.29098  ORF g.29098 m.29098 type:complete len:372 (-) comp9535_c0_seq4:901-2016(-)